MGFALSVLYLVTNYLTAPVLFGPLAAYRIELILAVLILLVSLPKLAGSIAMKTTQSLAMLGLMLATFMSVLVGEHWASGAAGTLVGFIPTLYAYFLIPLHINSKRKLQILVFMLLFVCLFVIAHGWFDLQYGVAEGAGIDNSYLWNLEHPYLLPFGNGTGEMFYRLKGQGFFDDPNDFGQLVVCVIPLVFIFWRTGYVLQNAFALLSVCLLLYGVYLTHSRGALLALLAMAVAAGRRRIGTVPALLLAGVLFAAAMALNFTGGRAISAGTGSDRTALWSGSMQLLKSHPLFGVGAGTLPDYLGLTAHNSVMVCAAELGLFGLYFWSLFLFSTARDALEIASPAKVSEGEPIIPVERPLPHAIGKVEAFGKAEVNNLGRLLSLSLVGYLVTGWFLSRAFAITFFLLGGMVEVVYEMALQQGMIGPRLPLARAMRYSGLLAIALILLMYINLRAVNLMH
jgi:O-antigen ligase